MKRQEKIDTIIIFKRVIKKLESGVDSFICNVIGTMNYSEQVRKAKEYLYSEIPRKDYNKTFYEHRLYNKWNPYLEDSTEESHKIHPWWFIESDKNCDSDIKECRKQRILFLRILIDKLNK